MLARARTQGSYLFNSLAIPKNFSRASLPCAIRNPQPAVTAFRSNLALVRAMSTSIPEKMKCILIKDGKGSAENLYMGEEKTPSLEAGQVLVKVCKTYAS